MIFRRAAAKLLGGLRLSSTATPLQKRSSIFLSNAVILGGQATVVMAEDVSTPVSSNDANEAEIAGLQKIEDGSITSNIHTQKWRVFTDSGRDLFLQGKLEDAEKLFLAAIQEAKEGFGDRDSHVASACNNLAELYRVKKELDKAEPLYLEAISILEESFGHDDIRVGAALHNLGQFYLVQQNLEQARVCYEIKRRVLGEAHPDYADTMYHLGTVLHFQGKEKDSETLIWDSIRILEMYLKSNRIAEAVNLQRKILHKMELSKGWGSLDTVLAAERLALTLLTQGSLTDAQQLLERCLDARKILLPENHIELKSLNTLALLEVTKVELQESKVDGLVGEAENALHQCISAFREFETEKSLADIPEVKVEYLSCLKYLFGLINIGGKILTADQSDLQQLKAEINRMEMELSAKGRPRS
nr:kinesin light chain 3 [Ipomoea trifida]